MTFFPDAKTFVQIGSLSIAWYAVFIITGAFIAYKLGQHNFKKIGYDPEVLSDYFFGVMITGILGARLWYVIFMWDEIYAQNPLEIIMFRHGGLAIQGGLIAGIAFSLWYFKKHNIDYMVAGDAIMPGVLIAQAFGRWGNFFNQEAHGAATSLSHLQSLHIPDFIIEGMNIGGVYYEPTFLYESLWCLLGLIIILIIRRLKLTKVGQPTALYLMWYGLGRFFIETMRTDSLMLGGFKVAQIISVIMVIIGLLAIMITGRKGRYEDLYDQDENETVRF